MLRNQKSKWRMEELNSGQRKSKSTNEIQGFSKRKRKENTRNKNKEKGKIDGGEKRNEQRNGIE